MKIILAGAGDLGTHLAKMLSVELHDITIIDTDESRLARVLEVADVVTINGSPTSIATLKKAGVQNADLFVATSPAQDQDVNIVSALLAKKLGAKKVTARINSEEYQNNENKLLFSELGVDYLFYPEKTAMTEIVSLLRKGAVSEFMDFSHGKLQLIVYRLEEGAHLIDRTLEDFVKDVPMYKAVAVARNGCTIIPRAHFRFKENDTVYIISKREGITEAMSFSGKEKRKIRKLMILGGGRMGEMVAKQLEKSIDHVKLIELKKETCAHLSEVLGKTLVINGDGRNSDLLFEENLQDYDAFVAVTSSSETNILAGMVAKRTGVPKVIAEVENSEYIKLAEGVGVNSIINKKFLTAGRIFRFTLSNKVRSIKVLNGTDAEILEFIVSPNSKITTGKIKDLNFPENAIIGGIIRGSESYIASEDTIIKPYDQVVVFATPAAISKVDKLFL